MKLTRKDFLRAVPLAAVAPTIFQEGAIARYDLNPPGHFIFFVDISRVEIDSLVEAGNEQVPLMPHGSKGGWIIGVHGDVENAVKIFRLNDKAAEAIVREEIELHHT